MQRVTKPHASYPLRQKSLAVKNSVLAMVWYLIGHQTPPDNTLDQMMSQWQTEAYDFLDQSLRAAELGQRASAAPQSDH